MRENFCEKFFFKIPWSKILNLQWWEIVSHKIQNSLVLKCNISNDERKFAKNIQNSLNPFNNFLDRRKLLWEKNPNFLDCKTVNFLWRVRNFEGKSKFLKSYQSFLGWEKTVVRKKSKFPWFWYSKFPLMGRKFEEKSKIPQILKSYQYFFRWKKKFGEENSLILMH